MESRLELKCQTITPLRMMGADNRTAQVRAASFRGVLRYWLRAALANTCGTEIAALRQKESSYFGKQKMGSPLRLQTISSSQASKERISYKSKAPLFYAGKSTPFHFYKANSSISLIFDTHPLRQSEEVFSNELFAGLLLAFRFGAFGNRARRGCGVLNVSHIDGPGVTEKIERLLTERPADHVKMKLLLEETLNYVFDTGTDHENPFGQIASYPAVTPKHVRLFIGKEGHRDWLPVMKQMWDLTKDYHRQGKWAWGHSSRRASALHMRVWQDSDNQYYPQVLFLYAGKPYEEWNKVDEVFHLFDGHDDFIRIHPK